MIAEVFNMADVYGEGSNSKKQWAKLKGAPLKEKVKYIAQYYGIAIVAIIAGIVFIVSMTKTIIYNSIPMIITMEVYSGIVSEDAEDNLMQKIAPLLGADPKKYHIEVTESGVESTDIQQAYTMSQKIFARMAARDLDCMVGKEQLLISYMSADDPDNRALTDLRELVSDDLYQRLLSEDKIVFLDAAEGKIPYGIVLADTDLADTIGLVGEGSVLAFVVTSERVDAQKALTQLIYE